MRVLQFIHNADIIQLNIQELIHALQRPLDRDVIFQLDGDLMVYEGFEEASRLVILMIFSHELSV